MSFLENEGDWIQKKTLRVIALARAVYSLADIYLFDDPFSAVDAQVRTHIFKTIMSPDGLLKGKTRVLATNRIDFIDLLKIKCFIVENYLITCTVIIFDHTRFYLQLLYCCSFWGWEVRVNFGSKTGINQISTEKTLFQKICIILES